MTARGRFITLEGVEGSGKSTLLGPLLEWIAQRGISWRVTREPGGTPFGAEVRRILLDPQGPGRDPVAELLLYLADRVQDVRENVLPALERGEWVFCDRYHDATLAYQGYARGIDLALIHTLAQTLRIPRPDLTILLDVDPALSLPRAIQRNASTSLGATEGRFEAESLAFHRRVREGYLQIAAADPSRFLHLDASRSAREVFDEATSRLAAFLPPARPQP